MAEKMSAYYNEIDPFNCAWLRELMKVGLIADGEVDGRDIREVRADDLHGFSQCHFFAGIGGWSLALRLAGWPDSRPVWSGSCPCQPYSAAGKGTKQSDERHLWPPWYRLIAERRPTTLFGEQVDEAIAAGWLDDIFSDLEDSAYSCASAVLPAYAVNASHDRRRLFFVAHADDKRPQGGIVGLPENPHQGNLDAAVFPTLSFLKSHGYDDIPAPVICRPNDGLSTRVGQLRGYGNAIVPELAAAFIQAASGIIGPYSQGVSKG